MSPLPFPFQKGFTPLHVAAKYGSLDVAQLLLHRRVAADSAGKVRLAGGWDGPALSSPLPHLSRPRPRPRRVQCFRPSRWAGSLTPGLLPLSLTHRKPRPRPCRTG